jgi:hypothetical protein
LRRSTRVAADVPVALDVLLEMPGENSQYVGKTITVNLHGALVTTPAPLKLSDQVKVQVHLTGKSAQAAVVFANHDLSQFGLELQTPETFGEWPFRLRTGTCAAPTQAVPNRESDISDVEIGCDGEKKSQTTESSEITGKRLPSI